MGSIKQAFRTKVLLQALQGLQGDERKAHLGAYMERRGWVTVAVAADRVFVTRETVRRWLRQNLVRRVTILGQTFISLPSLQRRVRQYLPEQAMALGINPACLVCGKATPDGETCAHCAKMVFPTIGATLGGDADDEDDAG